MTETDMTELDITEIKDRLSQPFQQHTKQMEEQLDGGSRQLDQQIEVVREWPLRRRKLHHYVITPLRKWVEALKQVSMPFNLKLYKKEKKKMRRAKYVTIYSWAGFSKKLQLFIMRTLNILRILIIISVFLGTLLFIGYLVMRVFEAIRG